MKEPSQELNKPFRKKIVSASYWVYRFSILFYAIATFMSSVADYGTKLILAKEKSESTEKVANNGKLPYETPAFTIFGSKFVSEAYATLHTDVTT